MEPDSTYTIYILMKNQGQILQFNPSKQLGKADDEQGINTNETDENIFCMHGVHLLKGYTIFAIHQFRSFPTELSP